MPPLLHPRSRLNLPGERQVQMVVMASSQDVKCTRLDCLSKSLYCTTVAVASLTRVPKWTGPCCSNCPVRFYQRRLRKAFPIEINVLMPVKSMFLACATVSILLATAQPHVTPSSKAPCAPTLNRHTPTSTRHHYRASKRKYRKCRPKKTLVVELSSYCCSHRLCVG